jgi:hypothetical protein
MTLILRAHQQFLNQILGLNIKAFREGIFKLLDLLPGEKVRETLESKPASDHLVYYTAKSPEIGAIRRSVTGGAEMVNRPLAGLSSLKQLWGNVLGRPNPGFRSFH